jgi:hypothetical protein
MAFKFLCGDASASTPDPHEVRAAPRSGSRPRVDGSRPAGEDETGASRDQGDGGRWLGATRGHNVPLMTFLLVPPFFDALPAPEAHTAPISEAPPHGPAQRLGETRVSVPFIVQRTRLGKAPG